MSSALEALEGEVVDPDGSVLVHLATEEGSEDVHVKAIQRWKASGVRAMRVGDFDTWAEKALTSESYASWVRLDPDLGEVESFFELWNTATGQSKGKSSASTRSSKSTARR